jgi:ABC-2 type transport system ATP-binding protein
MIRVSALRKEFGTTIAVNNVSFELQPNEIVGFVGPNGSGKTTTLRMIATSLYPTSGDILVDNLDVKTNSLEVRARLGYLPGDTPLYGEMHPFEYLDFIAQAHGLSQEEREERLLWTVKACNIESVEHKRIKECSTGYRKRIGLAAALIHDPKVLLLDEPTHGLDPLQILSWRELLLTLRSGRTIMLSSHVISDIAAICDRLLVIYNGALLADKKLDELRATVGTSSDQLENWIINLMRGSSSGGSHVGG